MRSAAAVWASARKPQELLWQYQQLKQQGATTKAIRIRDRIFVENQGLVHKQVQRFVELCSEPYDDLFQLGAIGLTRAIEQFDPALGNAFSSFAIPKIRSEIQHYLRDRGWHMRPPRRGVVEKFAAVAKAQRVMEASGKVLTLDETASRLGIDQGHWEWIKQARSNRPLASLEGDELQIEAPEEEESREAEYSWVLTQWRSLPEPQRGIVSERFFAGLEVAAIAQRRRLPVALVEILIEQGLGRIRAAARREA